MQERPAFAARPVLAAAAAVGVLLSAFSGGYGYERDELYFRLLRPAWGYVDQGPLTPLLARAMRSLSDTTWALRVPATLAVMAAVVVVALVSRELGGGRGAQALAAWGYAFAALPVILGHVLLTGTLDLPVWPAFVLCALRAVRRDDGRWWLAAGVVAGVSTYNKLLVVDLVLALAVGALVSGPRVLLRSPSGRSSARWLAAGAGLAVLVGLPNLVFQVAHGLPELAMGRALSDHDAGEVRVQMWPFLVLMLGPPLVPVWVAGLVRLWRDPTTRFVAAAFPVLLVLVFAMGSQVYYPIGLVSVLYAAGCGPAWRWLSTRAGWRRTALGLLGVNAAVSLVLGLPLVPLADLGATPVPALSQVAQDSVGWPTYVAQVARVHDALPPGERAAAIVYASNYGEAGAVDRYGRALGLPRVYSGQNQLGELSRPPASARVVVFVGGQLDEARGLFGSCRVRARLDDGVGVDNEEQGEPVAVCRGPIGGWTMVWPRLRHLD